MKVEAFSKGKSSERNEDAYGYSGTTLAVSDGCTDKSGRRYGGKTGGELISDLVVKSCLETDKNGAALVSLINERVNALYEKVAPDALAKPSLRFAATLVCARIGEDQVVITQVRDSAFRINEREIYRNDAKIDEVMSKARAEYIKANVDVAGGREHIMPMLRVQFQHANNARSDLCYGVIDGAPVPDEFIRVHKFARSDVRTIEIFTDGYFLLPDKADISAYEQAHLRVEREDPDKWKTWLSTKSKDDRTVLIARL